MVETLDDRQRNSGDWKALCYMESKEKGKTDTVYELLVYRRDQDDKQLFLFTKPKSEAGKGYLRIEKNLWSYDPSTGRWERRTERERIGGTDTRRDDLSEPRLAEDYDAKWEGDEKLGVFDVYHIVLTVKPGVDVSYPVRQPVGGQGVTQHPEAPGSGPVRKVDEDELLPEVEEDLLGVEEGRRLVPGGDALLRRDREGQLDPQS